MPLGEAIKKGLSGFGDVIGLRPGIASRRLTLEEERLKKKNIQERALEALLQQGQLERGVGAALGGGGQLPQAPTSPLAGLPRAELEQLIGTRAATPAPKAPPTKDERGDILLDRAKKLADLGRDQEASTFLDRFNKLFDVKTVPGLSAKSVGARATAKRQWLDIVSKIGKGDFKPERKELQRIAQELETNMEDNFGSSVSEKERRLATKAFRKITEEDINEIAPKPPDLKAIEAEAEVKARGKAKGTPETFADFKLAAIKKLDRNEKLTEGEKLAIGRTKLPEDAKKGLVRILATLNKPTAFGIILSEEVKSQLLHQAGSGYGLEEWNKALVEAGRPPVVETKDAQGNRFFKEVLTREEFNRIAGQVKKQNSKMSDQEVVDLLLERFEIKR